MGFDSWGWRDKIIMIWGLSIATLAVIFILVSLGNLISDNSSNIASWVQAIGSIAAIISGVWSVRHQLSVQNKESTERELKIERSNQSRLFQILIGRVSQMNVTIKAIDSKRKLEVVPWKSLAGTAWYLVSVLDKIPANEFPNPSTAMVINFLRPSIASLAQSLKDISELEDLEFSTRKNALMKEIDQEITALIKTLELVRRWLSKEIRKVATLSELTVMKETLAAVKLKRD